MLRIARYPAFILLVLAIGNVQNCARMQAMRFAEWAHAVYKILSSIRGGHDQRLLTRLIMSGEMGASLLIHDMTQRGLAYLCSCLRAMLLASSRIAHIAPRRVGMLIADHRLSMSLNLLRALLAPAQSGWLAAFGGTDPRAAFLRIFHAQTRSGNGVKVKAAFAKGIQLLKPILFAGGQHFRQHDQFQDIENEGIRPVLLPGVLQFAIMVCIALKVSVMRFSTHAKIDRAADIDFSGHNTGDPVYSGGVWKAFMIQWVHSLHPLIQGVRLGVDRATNTVRAASFCPHCTILSIHPTSGRVINCS